MTCGAGISGITSSPSLPSPSAPSVPAIFFRNEACLSESIEVAAVAIFFEHYCDNRTDNTTRRYAHHCWHLVLFRTQISWSLLNALQNLYHFSVVLRAGSVESETLKGVWNLPQTAAEPTSAPPSFAFWSRNKATPARLSSWTANCFVINFSFQQDFFQFIISVRRASDGECVYQKVLSCVPHPTNPLTSWDFGFPAQNISYRGLYPRSWTQYEIPELDIVLICRQISPIIPHDYKVSN